MGIPRKNMRTLNGYPLIYYSITTCLSSRYTPDVYVSSEDEEILSFAKRFGAKIYKRNPELSDDEVTLDPVIYKAYKYLSQKKKYDLVVTVQPTSPLLSVKSLDSAISMIHNQNKLDTIISGTDDTHLTWTSTNSKFKPNYKKRLNRQQLPSVYRETGGFLITKSKFVKPNSRIGKTVELFLLSGHEKIDIDDTQDWNICEYFLKRKNILFVVTGHNEVGTGHIYNALSIADEILNHNLSFLVDANSNLAFETIRSYNYTVYKQESDSLISDIAEIGPDVVINDILDTKTNYIKGLKNKDYLVINFEDLGVGAKHADLVINAMYPESLKLKNHYYGEKYFCLKNDFLFSSPQTKVNKTVKNILITFGGSDPNNFTYKVLNSIYETCEKKKIKINIVTGLAYKNLNTLKKFNKVNLFKQVPNLADIVKQADIVFTSAGRTTFELASIGIPSIVLCQNSREKSHFFASEGKGFINLGLNKEADPETISSTFQDLVNDFDKRNKMNRKMLSFDPRGGKSRVVKIIQNAINQYFK